MQRKDQKLKDTWDLSQIYKNEDLLKEDIKSCQKIVEKIIENKNELFESKKSILDFIRNFETIEYIIEKAYVYSHHKLDQDILDTDSQNLATYVESKYLKISEQLSFLNPLIMANKESIIKFLEEDELQKYRKYFTDIFRFKAYTLTSREEEILSMTGQMTSLAEKVYSSLVDSEFTYGSLNVDGKEVEITSGNFYSLLTNSNRQIRREAFQKYYAPYIKHNNTLALLYRGQIEQTKFYTKVRGYNSNIEKALYQNQIDINVYDNLIKVINDNININHEYIKLRKELLGVESLEFYDVYVPLIPEFDKEVKYEMAKEISYKALAILGDDYREIMDKAFNERWIDVYENENKRSGAYSGGTYKSPAYMLLNYSNKLNDLFTLVHEMGHSAHTCYAGENNSFFDAGYKIFVAEVASTVNELLLINYLLENSQEKNEKKYLLNYLLEQFRTTVIRQTMFAEFERISQGKVEKNEEVTKETFNQIYYDLNQKYFGKDIEMTKEIMYEWSRIPHFYYNFYVYQYATSFCAALEISQRILNQEDGFKDKYLNFLKLGDSLPPLDALKTINIDLTQKDVIENGMKEYQKTLKEFKDLNEF